jgi:hypothetical protein
MELRKGKQPMKIKYSTNPQIDLSMEIKIRNWQEKASSNAYGQRTFQAASNLKEQSIPTFNPIKDF